MLLLALSLSQEKRFSCQDIDKYYLFPHTSVVCFGLCVVHSGFYVLLSAYFWLCDYLFVALWVTYLRFSEAL